LKRKLPKFTGITPEVEEALRMLHDAELPKPEGRYYDEKKHAHSRSWYIRHPQVPKRSKRYDRAFARRFAKRGKPGRAGNVAARWTS